MKIKESYIIFHQKFRDLLGIEERAFPKVYVFEDNTVMLEFEDYHPHYMEYTRNIYFSGYQGKIDESCKKEFFGGYGSSSRHCIDAIHYDTDHNVFRISFREVDSLNVEFIEIPF